MRSPRPPTRRNHIRKTQYKDELSLYLPPPQTLALQGGQSAGSGHVQRHFWRTCIRLGILLWSCLSASWPPLLTRREGEKTEGDVINWDGLQPRCQLRLRVCSSSKNPHRGLVYVITALEEQVLRIRAADILYLVEPRLSLWEHNARCWWKAIKSFYFQSW